MTPVEFRACVDAISEDNENQIRIKYELSRFNSWLNLAPHLKNQSQQDLIRFNWEELQTAKIINGSKANTISEIKSSARRGE
jgi:hypothetical protein